MDRLNRVLRQAGRRATTPAAKLTLPAAALPEWVEVGHRLCYVSKNNSSVPHHVTVKKIEERKQTVLVTFDVDKKIWKRVPFEDISKMGDGALRPVWKPGTAVASVPKKPADFAKVEGSEDEVEVVAVAGRASAEESQPGSSGQVALDVQGPLPLEESGPRSSAAAGAGGDSATMKAAEHSSEEEREELMSRRMRRVQRSTREQALRSRSRTPKKSPFYVPGHMER